MQVNLQSIDENFPDLPFDTNLVCPDNTFYLLIRQQLTIYGTMSTGTRTSRFSGNLWYCSYCYYFFCCYKKLYFSSFT